MVDPVRGVTVASLSEDDPADSQMAGAVRRLSDHVRETLGEEHQLVQKSDVQLEKVMTPHSRTPAVHASRSGDAYGGFE